MSKEGYLDLKRKIDSRFGCLFIRLLKTLDVFLKSSDKKTEAVTITPQVLKKLKDLIRNDVYGEEAELRRDLRFFNVEIRPGKKVIFEEADKKGEKGDGRGKREKG